MAKFSATEQKVISIFEKTKNNSKKINFMKNDWKIIKVAKPTASKGEPKTDVYLLLENNTGAKHEIKISIKQNNADFLENKMSAKRAEVYFGSNWKSVIEKNTLEIKDKFENKILIFKNKYKRVEKGSITLGWKYEFLNKLNGELSAEIDVDLNEVYKGIGLDTDKKNAFINGERINNSGIADYLLFVDTTSIYTDAQSIIDSLILIDHYIKENPKVYFACKALNYRTLKVPAKWDGNRPLSVFVNWTIVDGKLNHEIIYNNPLNVKGNEVAEKLKLALESLNIQNTDNITMTNIVDNSIVYTT